MALILMENFRLRGAGYDDPNNSNTYEYGDLYRVVGRENLVEPKHGGFGCTLLSSVVERGCKCKMGMGLNVFMGVLGWRGLRICQRCRSFLSCTVERTGPLLLVENQRNHLRFGVKGKRAKEIAC